MSIVVPEPHSNTNRIWFGIVLSMTEDEYCRIKTTRSHTDNRMTKMEIKYAL